MSYTNIFGGSTIGPAYYSYIEYSLTAANSPINLTWPSQFVDTANNVAVIIDIQADNNGYSLVLPDAELVSVGQASVFVNKSAYTVTIYLNDGVTVLTTITTGQATYIYLTDNSTTNGTFSLIPFGAGYVAVTSVAAVSDSNNLTITGSPVINNGTFTFDFALDLLALSTFGASTGIPARTAANTWALRTITGTGNQISVTNGAGVAGNPILSLPAAVIFPGTVTLNQDAVQPLEAVTLQQLTSTSSGSEYKNSARVATTTNLTSIYNPGVDGVGAALTNNAALAALSIDGIALAVADRVLIKDQLATVQNGIYEVSVVGSGATAWVITRTTDYDKITQIVPGSNLVIVEGTINAATSWIETEIVLDIGVDPILFETQGIAALTASKVLVSSATGAVAVSTVPSANLPYFVLQSGSPIYGLTVGGTTAYTVTLGPAPAAYTVGMTLHILMNASCTTGPVTLSVNGLAAVPILKNINVDLAANDLVVNQMITIIFDGAAFQLQASTGGGSGTSTVVVINQVAHGFIVGDVLYHTGIIFDKAQTNTLATAEVIGMVSAVADVDNFSLLTQGEITLAGLTVGGVYFSSDTVAGEYTLVEPTTIGFVSRPLFVARSTTKAIYSTYRGNIVEADPGYITETSVSTLTNKSIDYNTNTLTNLPFYTPLNAGFTSTFTLTNVAVQSYGEFAMSGTGSFKGEGGYVDTAPVGAALIVDIQKNGVTIYATLPQFNDGANALTAGILKTDGTEDFVTGDRISFKVTQTGVGTAGQGVRFTLNAEI